MSKASSKKISELKSLRKDATSSKQEEENNPNNDKISELNKEILMKEENENQSQNQVLGTEQNKENEQKDEEKQSELIMKEQNNKEEQEKEEFINSEKEKQSQIESQYQELNDKDKKELKGGEEGNEAYTKEELEKKRKKLLMTEVSNAFDNKDFFSYHDLIVPGGKNASLCLVNDPFNKNLRVTDIADHYKFIEPQQVIVLIGANSKDNKKIKLFSGISRAALNTRAIIIDSGLYTGIEKFCLRKKITLIGIAPENKIEYPKINPEEFSDTLLTNGHTHFILLGKDDKSLNWGQEARFKTSFAERLANGRKGAYQYKAKVVGVILGNLHCEEECLMFIEKNWPLILVENSAFSLKIKNSRYATNNDDAKKDGENIAHISEYTKLIEIDDDSENLAASIHLCLSLSF